MGKVDAEGWEREREREREEERQRDGKRMEWREDYSGQHTDIIRWLLGQIRAEKQEEG